MKLAWHILNGVEVQVWASETLTRKAILFCPGFPGLGAAMFEQRHAGALVAAGYDVYVIHHKGTRTTGAMAPAMINNAARLNEACERREEFLGGGEATITEWLHEPLHVLNAIHEKYDAIDVIGNSFGVLSSFYSLAGPNAPTHKINHIIQQAGAQGVLPDIMRIWQPAFLDHPHVRGMIGINSSQEICDTLHHNYTQMADQVKNLPAHIQITYLVIEKDELFKRKDTEDFMAITDGRGKIVMDTADHAWPDHGMRAHDMPNFRTADLLKLLG